MTGEGEDARADIDIEGGAWRRLEWVGLGCLQQQLGLSLYCILGGILL